MITIRNITISYPTDNKDQPTNEYYAVVTHGEDTHYCATVVGNQGMFEWSFDQEMFKLALHSSHPTIKLRVIDYANCKTVDEFEVETKDVSSNSKNKTIYSKISKEKGTVELQIDYACEGKG